MLKVGDVVFCDGKVATVADVGPEVVMLITVDPLPSGVGANLEAFSPDGSKRVYAVGKWWSAKTDECQPVTPPGELALEIKQGDGKKEEVQS